MRTKKDTPTSPTVRAEQSPRFFISILEFIVLYSNVLHAKEEKTVGYQNHDESFNELIARLEKTQIYLTQQEMEAALWACQAMSEEGKFWHPLKKPFTVFLNAALNYKQTKKYFNSTYSWIMQDRERRAYNKKEGSDV
jgi:hypothetical protein